MYFHAFNFHTSQAVRKYFNNENYSRFTVSSLYMASLSLLPPLSLPPQLVTKVKLYRVVNSQVLATHSIALDSLHLLDERGTAILGVRYDNYYDNGSCWHENSDCVITLYTTKNIFQTVIFVIIIVRVIT